MGDWVVRYDAAIDETDDSNRNAPLSVSSCVTIRESRAALAVKRRNSVNTPSAVLGVEVCRWARRQDERRVLTEEPARWPLRFTTGQVAGAVETLAQPTSRNNASTGSPQRGISLTAVAPSRNHERFQSAVKAGSR